MYQVAVCDDENVLLEELGKMCSEILQEMGVRHQISMFSSVNGLREAMKAGERFDLLCLDILMPGKNGMEFAYEFRQQDDETSILFITSSTDFLLEGYGVRPVQYLLKPVRREDLKRVLADDIRLNHTPGTVAMTVGKKTVILPLSKIYYAESRSHGCVFVLEDQEQFFWLPLTQAEKMLPPEQFSRCHGSYLINLAKVVQMTPQEVELTGGIHIPISRRYAGKFQKALTRFLNSR